MYVVKSWLRFHYVTKVTNIFNIPTNCHIHIIINKGKVGTFLYFLLQNILTIHVRQPKHVKYKIKFVISQQYYANEYNLKCSYKYKIYTNFWMAPLIPKMQESLYSTTLYTYPIYEPVSYHKYYGHRVVAIVHDTFYCTIAQILSSHEWKLKFP